MIGRLRRRFSRELGRASRIGDTLRLVWRVSPGWAIAGLGVVILQSAVPPLILLALKFVIDAIGKASHSGDFSLVLPYVLLAAGLAAAETCLRALATLVTTAQGQVVADHVFQILIEKSATLDLAYYEESTRQDTMHRAQQEAPMRALALVNGLYQVLRSSVTLLGMMILLLSFSWIVVALLLIAMVPTVLVRAYYAGQLHALAVERTALERRAEYHRSLLTTGEAAKEIRFFDLGGMLRNQFADLRTAVRQSRLSLLTQRAQIEAATQVSSDAAVFTALGYLAFMAMKGAVGVGGLVIYFWALQFGRSLLADAMGGLLTVYEHNLFLSSFYEFLGVRQEVADPEHPRPVPKPIRRGIAFDNVSFRYPNSEAYALRDISLEIGAGEKIALVGENGSGKTSFVKLLCRFYDPTDGAIRLDGISLRDYASGDLRREIGVVFQDFMRYEFSARENIRIGDVRQDPMSPAVETAAAQTGIAARIQRLPKGFDSQLGKRFEGGTDFSIGEWQKIAVARAFMRDSQIMILDEPTSALDAESEYEVFQQFAKLAEGRTTILISHRLSTVRMADRIFVFEGGRIVESGSHDELMHKREKYARMFELQAEAYR